MILCFEGPDRAGKTVRRAALRAHLPGCYPVFSPVSPELLPWMPYVERWLVEQLSALYTGQTVVLDRSAFVTGRVYDRLYGREGICDTSALDAHVRVVLVDTPVEVLLSRHGDDAFDASRYTEVRELFREEAKRYPHLVVGGMDIDADTKEVLTWLRTGM